MIDKLKKGDRLEFLLKGTVINNTYNTDRILDVAFAIIAVVLMASGAFFVAYFSFFLFIVFAIRDLCSYLKRRKELFDEYFEIKPRSKD